MSIAYTMAVCSAWLLTYACTATIHASTLAPSAAQALLHKMRLPKPAHMQRITFLSGAITQREVRFKRSICVPKQTLQTASLLDIAFGTSNARTFGKSNTNDGLSAKPNSCSRPDAKCLMHRLLWQAGEWQTLELMSSSFARELVSATLDRPEVLQSKRP